MMNIYQDYLNIIKKREEYSI